MFTEHLNSEWSENISLTLCVSLSPALHSSAFACVGNNNKRFSVSFISPTQSDYQRVTAPKSDVFYCVKCCCIIGNHFMDKTIYTYDHIKYSILSSQIKHISLFLSLSPSAFRWYGTVRYMYNTLTLKSMVREMRNVNSTSDSIKAKVNILTYMSRAHMYIVHSPAEWVKTSARRWVDTDYTDWDKKKKRNWNGWKVVRFFGWGWFFLYSALIKVYLVERFNGIN